MKSYLACLSVICFSAMFPGTSLAVIIENNDRGVFEGGLGSFTVDPIETVSGAFGGTITLDMGDYTLFSQLASAYGVVNQVVGNRIEAIIGGPSTEQVDLIFTFDSPITAFGFDAPVNGAAGWGNGGQITDISFNNAGSETVENHVGGIGFFGFSSDTPFTVVTFSWDSGGADWITFDDITYDAAAVPEPSTAMPLLGLMLGLVWIRRKRMNKA